MADFVHRRAHYYAKVGNKPNAQWVTPKTDSLPRESFKVRGCRVPVHYIILEELEGNWILRSFIPDKNAKGNLMKVLVADDKDVVWRPMPSQTRLPPGAIRSEKLGKYGNMYVGRHKEKGVGMVVSMDMMTWTFYTHDGEEIEEGFEILCSDFSRLKCH